MPLVENGQIVQDRYLYVGNEEPIPERVPVIVPAQRFLANTDALIRRDGSLGVLWPNDRRIAELAPWLGHLALVALQFPKFRDGRADQRAKRRVLVGLAAERDLIELLAVFLHAENADMADVMVTAGIDAA